MLNQVREIFSTILLFREATDNFYNHCLSESARRDHRLDVERGVYTGVEELDNEHDEELARILGPLKQYSTLFSKSVQSIVQELQVHGDLQCRFLGTRLSFSDFYRKPGPTSKT